MLHFLRRKGGEFAAKILNGILILTISFSSLTYAMPIPAASAAAPVTIVLYSQSTYNNYSNFNDNGANSAYAWRWTPRTSGTPTEISLNVERTVGYPKGDICIRADKTATSASFGCVKGAIFFSGENSFALTDAAPVTAGTSYWVYFTRTSDANNYPSFRYTTSSAGAPLYRATASGIDPNYLWFSYDIAMTVKGVDSATAATTASSVPAAVLYSQLAQDDYSYFAYRGADERFAWEWTSTFDGTPTEISLFTEMVRGTPMGSICIRADKKAASTSFGCSGIVTFKAGENVIPLTGGVPVKAGVKYWVYYTRTSAGTWENNFAAFQYRSSVAGKNKTYRSAVLGADPTDADYWFTYDIKMAIRGTLTSAVVFAPPASVVAATPAPTGKISELVLYNETGRGGYSNFNWNAGKDNYAWELHTIADGVPNQITLYTHHVTGTPTGDICIRAGLSTTSQSFGCAKNVTFKAGENVIPLVGGEKIVWRNGYYVHFTRTSDANNYPSFEYRYPVTDLPVYRATAANAEPTTRWLNYNIAMKISNVQVIEELPVFTPDPVLAYSQTQANNYSSFNWNAANDTYAWMWEPTEDVVPTQIIIPTERVTGTATGIFCIRATRAIDSLSYGCSADTRLKTGDNLITLTPTGAALSKLGVYYVHFTRTSGLDNFPSFKYLDTKTYYPVFRSEQANGSPSLKWFSYNITMTIRGTVPTTPTAESQMIYGLSREEAQKVYDQLSTIPRSQGAIWAGRSNLAPRGFELAAKENPRYYYTYVFLIPERTAASYGGDTPGELIITYDELGAKLGKAPVTPWLGVTKTVDKTGYIYGMPRTEAEALYQVLKNEVYTPDSKMPLYLDAGKSEVIIGEGACVRDLRFRLAWNGLYRFGPGNVNGWLMLTKKEAEAKGFTDKTYEEAYADCLLSYHFLRPGFVANQYSTSVTSGINKVISFPAAEIPLAITFEQLEKTLGYPASGVLTPGLTYSANPSAFLVELPTAPTPSAQITLTPAAYLAPVVIPAPKNTKITLAPAPKVATEQSLDELLTSIPITSVVVMSEAQRILEKNNSLFQPTANSTLRYEEYNGLPKMSLLESAIQLCTSNKVVCAIAGGVLIVGAGVAIATIGASAIISGAVTIGTTVALSPVVANVAITLTNVAQSTIWDPTMFTNAYEVNEILTSEEYTLLQKAVTVGGIAVGGVVLSKAIKGGANVVIRLAKSSTGKIVFEFLSDGSAAAKNWISAVRNQFTRQEVKLAIKGAESISSAIPLDIKSLTTGSVKERLGNIARRLELVNPGSGRTNCVPCARATDSMFTEKPVSAIAEMFDNGQGTTDLSYLETFFGRKLKFAKNYEQIEEILLKRGDNARGIIIRTDANYRGHAFNVINIENNIYYLDGQTKQIFSSMGEGNYHTLELLITN